MQSPNLISTVLCTGLAASSAGCYASRTIENLADETDKTVSVETHDGSVYELDTWELLDNGDIRGQGKRKRPRYDSDAPLVSDYEGVRSSRVIVRVFEPRFNAAGTAIIVVGSAGGLVAMGVLLHAIFPFGHAVL